MIKQSFSLPFYLSAFAPLLLFVRWLHLLISVSSSLSVDRHSYQVYISKKTLKIWLSSPIKGFNFAFCTLSRGFSSKSAIEGC
ncbi:hypothetical protein E1A91_D06G192000v1 [Gossypium mustelinum]|uniref:Uncharacterized protein n=1 Tax=Gossypium mustelinum TaxID=34275 RepID=A0A5D2UNN0_GOSMU|nr:hypothetical protein E1A91_D06G192000v1 [Gossypium mustelinum]